MTTTAPQSIREAAKEPLRQIWKDRIEREFCIYSNFSLQAQPDLATRPTYAYSQISWQIGSLLSFAQQVCAGSELEMEDAVNFLIEIAHEEHNRTFRAHLDA